VVGQHHRRPASLGRAEPHGGDVGAKGLVPPQQLGGEHLVPPGQVGSDVG
jgi:hypothetical protein